MRVGEDQNGVVVWEKFPLEVYYGHRLALPAGHRWGLPQQKGAIWLYVGAEIPVVEGRDEKIRDGALASMASNGRGVGGREVARLSSSGVLAKFPRLRQT